MGEGSKIIYTAKVNDDREDVAVKITQFGLRP